MNITELSAKAICLLTLTRTCRHIHVHTQYGKESACTRKQIAQTLYNKSTMPATFNACYRLQTTKLYHHTNTHACSVRCDIIHTANDCIRIISKVVKHSAFISLNANAKEIEKDLLYVALFEREKAHKREQIKITWKMTFFFSFSF